MELRTLKYFLTVIEEGSFTNAAKRLHITQPTLSRQLSDLEQQLGRQLYNRSHSGIVPTEHGVLLAKYAESIVGLAEKAEADISLPSKAASGHVHIACGETKAIEVLADAMLAVRQDYPDIDFELYSGTSAELMDGLVRGRYDFMLECELQPHVNLNVLEIPHADRWGVVMLGTDPLAHKDCITCEDVLDRHIITSRQGTKTGKLSDWFGAYADSIDVIATYNLAMNCKFLVKQGVGIAFVYEGLIEDADSELRFIPLEPQLISSHGLLWRRTLLSKQAQVFLDVVKERVSGNDIEAV